MSDLLVAVVHDVKNQLAELALRLERRGDAQQEMALALNAARRLSEMLLVHREQNGQLSVNQDSVDPSDFLDILAAEYRELFPHREIGVDNSQAPPFAFFDDGLVRMALANALHNACRHASRRVMLRSYSQDGQLVLEVADDGEGFSSHQLGAPGEAPAGVSERGTGMGLYLARRIAELHQLDGRHGSIVLLNQNGGVFRMLLP